MRIGFLELTVILAIMLLFFGPKQVPKLATSIKEAIKDFKDGTENPTEIEEIVNEEKES